MGTDRMSCKKGMRAPRKATVKNKIHGNADRIIINRMLREGIAEQPEMRSPKRKHEWGRSVWKRPMKRV